MSFDDINDANFDKVRYQALKASAGSVMLVFIAIGVLEAVKLLI